MIDDEQTIFLLSIILLKIICSTITPSVHQKRHHRQKTMGQAASKAKEVAITSWHSGGCAGRDGVAAGALPPHNFPQSSGAVTVLAGWLEILYLCSASILAGFLRLARRGFPGDALSGLPSDGP